MDGIHLVVVTAVRSVAYAADKDREVRKKLFPMSFARLRARIVPSNHSRRRLYDQIQRVDSRPQRDELLIMAQRAEAA